jgi:hypothetical protein
MNLPAGHILFSSSSVPGYQSQPNYVTYSYAEEILERTRTDILLVVLVLHIAFLNKVTNTKHAFGKRIQPCVDLLASMLW